MPEPAPAAAGPRAFWSGTISFGLVTVPVDLWPAQRRVRPSLRMLAPDGTPLARRYYCPAEDVEVPREHLVRGYEVRPGEHVLVSDEELEALAPEKSREIDLRRFVPADAIAPRTFQRAYYLTPSGDTTKAYRLLAAVMESTGRAGIATFVMRGKEYLVAILSRDGILRAETLRFADELRDPDEVGLAPPAKIPKAEIARFTAAIDALAAETIDREEMKDDETRRIEELARKKSRRRGAVVEPETAAVEDDEPGGEVVDLLEVIRQSLAGGGRSAGARRERAATDLSTLSKDELYRRAQERDLPGRSSMTKDQLVAALREVA